MSNLKLITAEHVNNVNTINQTEKHSDTGTKYATIRTDKILDYFTSRGFTVASTHIQGWRVPKNNGFQKHMIRLEHPDIQFKNVNDTKPQILLLNSHNLRSSLSLQVGLFRMVCLNGLIVSDGTFESIRIRHVGNVLDKLDAALPKIVAGLEQVESTIELMKNTELSLGQERSFALDAQLHRVKRAASTAIEQSLTIRRSEDSGLDLWSVYNRVQENIIKHGFRYTTYVKDRKNPDGPKVLQSRTARPIQGVDSTVEFNRFLFEQATKLIKGA